MGVAKITTHTPDAVARLLTQYKEAINIQSLISIYADQAQLFEDSVHPMLTNRMVDLATGLQLDRIGDIVGQLRQGASDAVYRVRLKFRIGVNVSEGRVNEVGTLFKLISGVDYVQVHNVGQGSIELEYSPTLDAVTEAFIFANIGQVLAAGVQIAAFIETENANAFTFSDLAGGTETGKGFDDLTAPGDGGILASIVAPNQLESYQYGYPGYGRQPVEPNVKAQWLFDEASGNIVDVVNGIVCTPVGTPIYSVPSSGIYGGLVNGITLDADPSYFQKITASSQLDFGTLGGVIEVWYAGTDVVNNQTIINCVDGGTGRGWRLGFASGSLRELDFLMKTEDDITFFKSSICPTNFADGNPHKIRVIVNRAGDLEVRFDGVIIGTASMAAIAGKSVLCKKIGIGWDIDSANFVFRRTMYELRATIGNITNNSGGPNGG